jgi:hypothetical protein
MELIKEIEILEPPTFYLVLKKNESKKQGKNVYQKYYLTANLFFNNGTSFFVISKIVQDCKLYLKEHIGYIPELEKMRLEIEYHANKHIDLDNKAYFWKKLFLDVLKTPTPKQIENSKKKNKLIITTNTIYDDTTKYVDEINEKFIFGGHKMIFRIYGRVLEKQKEINLI